MLRNFIVNIYLSFSINLSNISRIFLIVNVSNQIFSKIEFFRLYRYFSIASIFFDYNIFLDKDIISITDNYTFKCFQLHSLYRRNDTFENFSHVLCSFCSYICNYSNEFIDRNFSIFIYILRPFMNSKNSNIHYVLKIIFKNRVFVKNLHFFIICKFDKALKFNSNFDFQKEFEVYLISLLNEQFSLFYTSNRCYFAQYFFKVVSIELKFSHMKILIENHSEHLLKIS